MDIHINTKVRREVYDMSTEHNTLYYMTESCRGNVFHITITLRNESTRQRLTPLTEDQF